MGDYELNWVEVAFWMVLGWGVITGFLSLCGAIWRAHKRARDNAEMKERYALQQRENLYDMGQRIRFINDKLDGIQADTQKIRRYVVPRLSGPPKEERLKAMADQIRDSAKYTMDTKGKP